MKQYLLATTALAGVVAFAGQTIAGSVGTTDNFEVKLGATYRFNVALSDQDRTMGRGRGYAFSNDESEVLLSASWIGENGLTYGLTFELNALARDGTAADETYMFADGPLWGRIELGDQDDAADRIFVAAEDALVGRAGFDGDVGDSFAFNGALAAPELVQTSDDTKVIYFTPRFGGVQLGASLTPDTGSAGFGGDGDEENVVGVGANWSATLNDANIVVAAIYEFADDDPAPNAADAGDLETIGVGGTLTLGNWAFGAGHVDFGGFNTTAANAAAGQDAGEWFNVGGSYKAGPWGVSVGWFSAERGGASQTAESVDILSVDVAYAVVPGWSINASLNFVEGSHLGRVATFDNDGHVFILNNTLSF